MKRIILSGLLLTSTIQAGSVGGFGGSLEVTQLLNFIELYDQTQNTLEEVRSSKNILQNAHDQAKGLNSFEWGNSKNELMKLNQLVRKGESLAYSAQNMDALFSKKFSGYSDYQKKKSGTTFNKRYENWNKTNMDSIKSSLMAANMQSNQLKSEANLVNKLNYMSQNKSSQIQALQVGHQIAAQQIGQLQKLRQLVMAQMQSEAAYKAVAEDRAAFKQAKRSKLYERKKLFTIGNEEEF